MAYNEHGSLITVAVPVTLRVVGSGALISISYTVDGSVQELIKEQV